MKKEHLITTTYLLVSVGLFVLAIETWICGGAAHCRDGDSFVSKVAKAGTRVVVPGDGGWSGPYDDLDFSIGFTHNPTSVSDVLASPEVIGDGGADGDDGH